MQRQTDPNNAATLIADGLTGLLTWASEPGDMHRTAHIEEARTMLSLGIAEALRYLKEGGPL